MHRAFPEIQTEFADIESEFTHLAQPDEAALSRLYAGFERVMGIIASEVDGDPIPAGEDRGAALLNRVATAYPRIREAVISPDCRDVLERLRTASAADLAQGRHDARVALAVFRDEVETFFEGDLDEDDEGED